MAESFDLVFQGDGKSECIEFIQAVRKYAKKKKKMRDNQWIADEVFDAFGGEALGWYVRLPVNVREDWELLQQALAARWIPEEDENVYARGGNISSRAAPPMAAAAPLAASPSQRAHSRASTLTGKIGRVRIGMRGIAQQDVRYLSKNTRQGDWLDAFDTTVDEALAMKVRLVIVEPNFHRLELVEHESKLSVLAAFMFVINDWNNNQCRGIFVGVDAPGQGALKDRRTTFSGSDIAKSNQFWTDRWQLGATGVLTLCNPGNTSETARFALKVDGLNKGSQVWIGPKVPKVMGWVETALQFEPING